MFLNCSNHPVENWEYAQREAAETMGGEIKDYPFPKVSPEIAEDEIAALAESVIKEILQMKPAVVMCQGEFTLTYALVKELQKYGIKVVAACSERLITEKTGQEEEGDRHSSFAFIRFREYR